MAPNQIPLKASSITRLLATTASLLVVVSVGGQMLTYLTEDDRLGWLARLFYIDAEKNIPSYFSSLLLLFAAQLLALITAFSKQQAGSRASYWAFLSFGFLFMAADEAWSFHEKLIRPVRGLLGDGSLGIFYFAWVIPGISLVLVLAPFFVRFLLGLPLKTRLNFLMAATLYLGGAIGFELIGGKFAELHGRLNLRYSMLATVEESLEMAGAIVFIRTLIVYLDENYRFMWEGRDQ